MLLEPKDVAAILLMLFAIPAGTIAALVSHRVREAMFFLMVVVAVIPGPLDINFVSRFWYYRGTTRGFEVSVVDIFAICLLAASILLPKPGQKRAYWPAAFFPLVLYLFYCAASVLTTDPKIYGAFELTKVFRCTLIFLAAAFYVRTEKELRILVLGL